MTATGQLEGQQQVEPEVKADVRGEAQQPSIEKKPVVDVARPSPFERLPDEIIEQILQLTDPNSFASLVLLNSKWRSVSQQAHLYAHQLARCPSYAASHKGRPVVVKEGADNDSLVAELRRQFVREVKRNLFESYLRPSMTIIKLVSNSISSSSCPGGEGMQFHPSPKGHHLLAYNSSRIYLLDLRTPEITVRRELKILRRPAATCILDDGSVLAVLLTEMQVDVYDLKQSPPKRTQSIILDHGPRAIAMSPCGSVLAAAYEGGIEVSSLHPGALPTDRRSVKCDGVDALSFSFDGTQILGTTVHSAQPNTVILTAPYYDPGSHMESDDISALWTTSILFPNTSRDCSHAVLLQDSSFEEASWTFTYDRSFETFRAVRIDDLRNGTTYFTGPVPSQNLQGRLLPCTLPAASYRGDLVAAGFQGKEIWIYGVPEDLDAVPLPGPDGVNVNTNANAPTAEGSPASAPTNGLNRRNSGPSARSVTRMQEQGGDARVPQWQILCDKLRNTVIGGTKIGELNGVSTVKWVSNFGNSSLKERLVVAARGVMPPKLVTEEDGIDFVDGGRLTLFDFDYGIGDGQVREITIEVGTKEPEVLEEEHRDLDTEVAIVRRRTVAQRRGNSSSVARAATTASRVPPLPHQHHHNHHQAPSRHGQEPMTHDHDADDPLVPRRIGVPPVPPLPRRTTTTEGAAAAPEETDSQSVIEEQEALDLPYSHASPRSGTTLRRAATAAAINRRLHPQPAVAGNVEYRRADGRPAHPHESDADNWVPPPPPYQKEDPVDLPAFLRHNVPAVTVSNPGAVPSDPSVPSVPSVPPIPSTLGQGAQTLQNPLPSHPPVPPIPQQHQDQQAGRFLPPQLPSRPVTQPAQINQGANNNHVSPLRRATQWIVSHPVSGHQRFPSDSTSVSRPPTSDTPRRTSFDVGRGHGGQRPQEDDDIYDVSPPSTPQLALPPTNTRGVVRHSTPSSGTIDTMPALTNIKSGSTMTSGPAPISTPSPIVPAPISTGTPTAAVATPSANVSPASTTNTTSPRQRPPVLDLEIPSGCIGLATTTGTKTTQDAHYPAVTGTIGPGTTSVPAPPPQRRISNAQTWPRQPRHDGPTQAVVQAGYPYSAPPTNFDVNRAIAESYPPAPSPEQIANLNRHSREMPPPAHRLSGAFQVARVPVGSRDPSKRISGQQLQQQQCPHSQQYQHQQPQQMLYSPRQEQPQPQNVVLHQPRPQRPGEMTVGGAAATPPPDTPLIISTPRGITGAFDPPGSSHSLGHGRAETPIVAPVPRHPRTVPGSAGSSILLRPTVERLETIYSSTSAASGSGNGGSVMMSLGGPGPSSGLAVPPIPISPSSSSMTAGTGRHPSVSRKQSRAERSAAKNMADAKRKGWRGRTKSNGRRLRVPGSSNKDSSRPDLADGASTTAWTDVTVPVSAAAAMGPDATAHAAAAAYRADGRRRSKDRKCVVM